MKNFYEATVIKDSLTIPVKIVLTPVGKLPCKLTVNHSVLFEDTISKIETLHYDLGIHDALSISMQIYRHHPDAVMIKLTVDDKEIIPLYQHLASPPTSYFNISGTWLLRLPSFYAWYHEESGEGWIID